MARIACEFPITVELVGVPSPAALADLGRAVEEALAVRFREATAVHGANGANGAARSRIRPQLPESVVFDPGPAQPAPELAREVEQVLLRAVARAVARLGKDELWTAGQQAANGSAAGALLLPAADPAAGPVPVPVEPAAEPLPSGRALLAFSLPAETAAETAAEAATAGPEALVVLPAGPRLPTSTQPRGRRRTPATAASPTPGPTRQPFQVRVNRAMDSAKLLREFVRQYYGLTSEAEVDRRMASWHWNRGRERSVSAEEIDRPGYPGYVVLYITDPAQAVIKTLPEAEQQQINAEADERFWRESGLPPGTKFGTGPEDEARRARWRGLRAAVADEHLMRRRLAALPEDVRQILLAGDRPLDPTDLETVLRLARKVSELTPAQRRDYLSKVAAEAASWTDLDASIDRYLRAEHEREAGAEQTEAAAASLFGCEDVYRAWTAVGRARAQVARAGRFLGPRQLAELSDAIARFDAALKRHGFADEQAFLGAVEAYRLRFQAEAVTLGLDLLTHYDHLLYEERQRLQTPGYVEAIVDRIAKTSARADLEAALKSRLEAAKFPEPGSGEAAWHRSQAESLRAKARRTVAAEVQNDPLLDPETLGRGADLEGLAELDAPAARTYLLGLVEKRRSETGVVRQEFTQDPERVFSLPKLVEATKRSQGVGEETIYAWIVDAHVKAVHDAHLFSAAARILIALLLTALVPGGGWVAATAVIASAGLAVYQASEAIAQYWQESAEYPLGFIDDEPSLFWVVLAVAGAASEIGMPAAQVLKGSAKGLSSLKTPLREFSAATEAGTAAARYRTLLAKIDEVEGLEPELAAALKSRAAAELGLKRVVGEFAGRLNASFLVDPTGPLRGMFYAVKKGLSTIEMLRADARMMELLGDVTALTGAEAAELKVAFKQVKQIVDAGKRMDEAMVLRYIDRLAAERSAGPAAFEELLAEMRAWRPPTAEQVKAEKELAEAGELWVSLLRERNELLAELRAGPKTPTGARDEVRIAKLRKELAELEGRTSRTGERLSEGAITRAEQQLRKAERLAEAARVSPADRMRQVFNVSAEREIVAASAKIDQVGALRRSSGELQVDHIVSLERMTQMEGFDLLTALERNRLAVRPDDLILMDASANASKGARSWATWRQASDYYDAATIARMRARDQELTARIEEWIRTTVRGRRPVRAPARPRIAEPEAQVRVDITEPGPQVRVKITEPEPLPAEELEPPAEEARKRLRSPLPGKPER